MRLSLLSCILVTHASAQLPYAIFEDVPASKPYYDQVNLLRERLVTQGCSVHPAQYCPDLPYALTRGQAAVLIIRSIYSARTGDPEGFTYPSTPYFTDVPADHEQFKYIQKMKELGITSGYTATTYEPWGTLNFGQIAVFSHRARQVRLWQPVSAPYPCSYAPFPDVPSDYPFCPYIRDMASELGNDKAISPNCWTGFCPESIPMSRGALAFYLANGVMNVGQPQWLPNGGGAVPGVLLPGPPEPDCSHGGFFAGNQIMVLGGQLYSWAQTFANSAANPEVWNLYTAMRLVASGTQLQFDEDHSSYGAIWSATQSYNVGINPNLNYRNDAWHSIASMCLANGNSWFNSVNNPVIVGLTTPPVLYRGISQSITARGSTLQNFVGVSLVSTSTPLPISNPAASQYQVTVTVTPPFDTSPGPRQLYLRATSPNDGLTYATNSLPVTVADPTPSVTSITPSTGTQGSTLQAFLNGSNFGANPTVCILVSGSCLSNFGGVAITRGVCGLWPSCNSQIPITITIDSNAAVTSYSIGVLSQGASGFGFASGGGSQQTTPAPVSFQVQAAGPPVITSLSLETIPVGATSASLTINGSGFGSSPTVLLPQGWTLNSQGSSSTAIVVLVSVGNNSYLGSNTIRVTSNGQLSNPATIDVTANVNIKLEMLQTVISTDGQYSEDTTIRATAVRAENGETLTAFVGTVQIGEEGTPQIYAQNGGSLPMSVDITSAGTTTFLAKSLASPKTQGAFGTKPDDALITVNSHPIFGGVALVVPQWIVSSPKIHSLAADGVYDWVQAKVKDIFASASADVLVALSAVGSYAIRAEDAGGSTSRQRAPQSPIFINPYFTASRLNGDMPNNCGVTANLKWFRTVLLHEARHAYQAAQASISGNDDDADWLVKNITHTPTTVFLDSTNSRAVCDSDTDTVVSRAYHGDSSFDQFLAPDFTKYAFEMDAWMFSGLHANN